MKLLWKSLAVAAGLAFFGWFLSGVGFSEVWDAVSRLGLSAPLILVPYFVVYVIDCFAWSKTLPAADIPFLTRLRIRWAGESVNNIIPSAYVGGEAVKVWMLRSNGINAKEGATSAIVSKTAQSIAQFLFILIASVILLQVAGDRPGIKPAVVFVVLIGFTVLGGILWVQKAGLNYTLSKVLSFFRLRFQAVEKRKAKLAELDAAVVGFYREQPQKFYASTAFYFAGWMLDTVEIYLVAHLLGLPITWAQALVVEAFTGMAKALGMWIPGSLGIQESGIVLIGRLGGLPDALSGAYALIRRGREIIFAAVGMLLLYRGNVFGRSTDAAAAATR
jgi:glycosyltransferase 2 family protein